jgi:hypothetical protein
MREGWWFGPLKLPKIVMRLGLWRWLMPLSLLHVGHSLLHGLQYLSLHYQNLLKCWGGGGLLAALLTLFSLALLLQLRVLAI